MTGSRTHARQLVLLAATLAALQVSEPARAIDGEAAFIDAMVAYQDGSFSVAETRLQAAAQEGYPQAHEILGIMYTVGPPLYAGIQPDRQRAAHHFESAARLGSVVSRYMLCALGRQSGNGQPLSHACARAVTQPPSHVVLGNLPYELD